MDRADLLPISEIARRAGLATSALRYYERQGLINAVRTSGGQRRYQRNMLRRLAFIRAAQSVGLSLQEIRTALDTLPAQRTPTTADWARLSRSWRTRLDEQIAGLTALRDGLTACIGCGCLSLRRCRLSNPNDTAAGYGAGARYLPTALHRPLDATTRSTPHDETRAALAPQCCTDPAVPSRIVENQHATEKL